MRQAFHPVICDWFANRFGKPTQPQELGWPHIVNRRHTLIAAPTGSGKTFAAFLAAIDDLFRQSIRGALTDSTQVLYISPLRALSNDIGRNLADPLAQIEQAAGVAGCEMQPIRALVRTGDTSAARRQAMLRKPPHILVTTPESLYLMLTAAKSRQMLRTVSTVIVDETHALVRDKRGSHLSLSLERLDALCKTPPVRIGLSATQKPIDQIAAFLVGPHVQADGQPDCAIVDVGHVRALDLAIEVPPSDLAAVCTHETWDVIFERLTELIKAHRSTLIFVNTRRMAERIAHRLSQTLGIDAVASHHGSLSQQIRQSAEQRLKDGQLKVIIATPSLELSIDVGYIDLVCQIASPRSIATLLQRIGRSGHALRLVPKGRLFPLTRDDLIEALALVHAVGQERLDSVVIPQAPLDILAQQIVASVACDDYSEDELYELCRGAWPYRNLPRRDFDQIIAMLSEGIGRGQRRGAYLHRDQIHGRVRARRHARLAALSSGGAIPEQADYRVVTEDDRSYVGSVNEDFAIESMAGDVFLLGSSSWRIRHVRGGEVVVRDAHGAPATIPFWLGEAPARTDELSAEVSDLRKRIAELISDDGQQVDTAAAEAWLIAQCGACEAAARQAANYVAVQVAAVGGVPTVRRIIFERFFDESGGTQLVIHSPLGGRINRAWGLSMRKRFCRTFDFELQAAADDNGIVLSLGPQHSVPTDRLFKLVPSADAEHVLTQALLAAPMFLSRSRWNTTRALAVMRRQGGKKVPPPLQRFRADDLLTAVFPAQTACFENRPEDVDVPDHPLVRQTVHDCMTEAMDFEGFVRLLGDIESQRVELVACDTREPSPFSHELLNANPYAFLDDAPLEERRARAVSVRRSLAVDDMRDLAMLDPQAIAQVRAEAQPSVRDVEELHDALLSLVAMPLDDAAAWRTWLDVLIDNDRAVVIRRANCPALVAAAEHWPMLEAMFPHALADRPVQLPAHINEAADQLSKSEAITLWVRGHMEVAGPVTAEELGIRLGLDHVDVATALELLEAEGGVMRGQFGSASADSPLQWCDRRLLARIHRITLDGLRRQIRPVSADDYVRFLVRHHRLGDDNKWQGRDGLCEVIARLEGYEMPAGVWESPVLAGRVEGFESAWLDELTLSGQAGWGRIVRPRRSDGDRPSRAPLHRLAPICLMMRDDLTWLLPPSSSGDRAPLHSHAGAVLAALESHGALFIDDLIAMTDLLTGHVESALKELAAQGRVTADSFAAVRKLVTPASRRASARRLRDRSTIATRRPHSPQGRWSMFPGPVRAMDQTERCERWAWLLIRRYGVIGRDLLARESAAPRWGPLLKVYRRLEAQGQLRGGRFVDGLAGEQFATDQTVERLRAVRDEPGDGKAITISAADPVNLSGLITAGPRISAAHARMLCICDGRFSPYETTSSQSTTAPAVSARLSAVAGSA